MTEADQRLIHAYVAEGGCWHEWEYDWRGLQQCRCGATRYFDSLKGCGANDNPDYSTRQHFPDLTAKLFGDEQKIMVPFYKYATNKWAIENDILWFAELDVMVWLFHPDHYARFVALFAKFLRLPETVREFGWEKCPYELICSIRGVPVECSEGNKECTGSGQILRPWAKLVKEGK